MKLTFDFRKLESFEARGPQIPPNSLLVVLIAYSRNFSKNTQIARNEFSAKMVNHPKLDDENVHHHQAVPKIKSKFPLAVPLVRYFTLQTGNSPKMWL